MRVKNKKLANKIAFLISTMLITIFAIFIALTLILTQRSISVATFNDLHSISKANGAQIQEFMNIAKSTALGLIAYMDDAFGEEADLDNDDHRMIPETTSVVYPDLELSEIKKELESYMITAAKNAVKNNDSVIGIGIMFEPYQFTKDRESYALYFTSDGSEIGVSDVGAYSEFSKNEYYQIAVGKTETIFTKPYIYRDMWMITGATPINVNGKQIGVINVDISMSEFNKLNLQNENYPSLTVQVVSDKGIISFDSQNTDNISKNMLDISFKNTNIWNQISSDMQSGQPFRHQYSNKSNKRVCSFFYPLKAGSETWQTVTTVSMKDILKSTVFTILILTLISVVSLIAIIMVSARILKGMLHPINDILTAAESIAHGNLDIQLEAKSNDEIGVLSNTFSKTCQSLKNMINDISNILDNMANNNFDVKTDVEYEGDFIRIRNSIQNIIGNLNSIMKEINSTSEQVSDGSEQLSDTSQILANSSEEHRNAVNELSENLTEVIVKIDKNAENAIESSKLSKDVGQEVKNSNVQMEDMLKAMVEISEASSQIELIIKSIEDIASQTNMLALNAAIEAARAGDAGKGFAVVADEIRKLASQSSEAAKDTRQLIGNSIDAVNKGTQIADLTEQSMGVLASKIENVVNMIELIAEASVSQKESVNSIEQNIERISGVVDNNSNAAEVCAASSEELSAQSQILKSLVKKFNLKQ